MNDLSVGRSPSEGLRTVQAFQSGGLCGADCHKGGPFAGGGVERLETRPRRVLQAET